MTLSLHGSLTIARSTLMEAVRRRLVLALALLTVALMTLTVWGFSRLAADINIPGGNAGLLHEAVLSQLLILIVFGFSGVLTLAAALVAAPAITAEIDSGTLAVVAARPVSRLALLLGRWLGVAGLVTLYTVVATALEFTLIWLTTGYSAPDPLAAIVFLVLQGLIITSLTLMLSTRLGAMTSGMISLVAFFLGWIAGITGVIGAALNNGGLTMVAEAAHVIVPTDLAWRGTMFALEPPSVVFSASAVSGASGGGGDPFLSGTSPGVVGALLIIVWLVVVLGLAAWSLERREI